MSERKLFGTDGVRGRANVHPMTPEVAMNVGRAIAQLHSRPGHRSKIVIGKDTRLSGYMFETALAAGICSVGADVLLCGPLPTPGIAYITRGMRADAGVVISASHNPYPDNGIKLFGPDGYKLPDETELELERWVFASESGDGPAAASPDHIGKAFRVEDVIGRYVTFLKGLFPKERDLEGVRVVVDCAHGAAYKVAPAVLTELGATVIPLGVSPDGQNINDACGAVHPQAMAAAVVKHGAQLGIALDGDADRVQFADEKGNVINGDAIMAVSARRMLADGTLRKGTVVATVMSTLALDRVVEEAGGSVVRTQVGDRYVVDTMRKEGYSFGGEQSGHLIYLDHSTTGDGCIAALEILRTVQEEDKPLSELASILQPLPQKLVNVKVKRKPPLTDEPRVLAAIDQVEKALGREGRVLVRYSGTEPKVRVLVEGPEATVVAQHAETIAGVLAETIG